MNHCPASIDDSHSSVFRESTTFPLEPHGAEGELRQQADTAMSSRRLSRAGKGDGSRGLVL